MEVFADNICLTGSEITQVIPYGTFKSLINRGKISSVSGRACYGNPARYIVDMFPHNYRAMLYEAYPELSNENNRREIVEEQNIILRNIMPDPTARNFFAEYRKANGDFLKPEERTKYENSAMILNAMWRAYNTSYSAYSKSGNAHKFRKGETWKKLAAMMPTISENYVNILPSYWLRLQQTAEAYAGNNYASLLNGRIGNKNRSVVTPKVESIILSIYGTKEKPFVSEVLATYNEFLLGMVDIVNRETGEIYDRRDFYKNGEPVTISEATVWKVINKPVNRRLVDARRNDFHYNQQKHTPHVDRESPRFSLSKISMDDCDLVRKTTDGKWVHAYYAYDVASGCVIGAAHSLTKDPRLVFDCFRNMWQNLKKWELNTPYECEVENHLMEELSDRLHNTFMEVTFCAPMNSQEKRAEHFNKKKKYYGKESERRQGMAHGRWYAKHEAYLYSREKIFDSDNHNYKQSLEPASFEAIVAEDRAQIEKYNNAKHSNKDFGMTRMEVLLHKQFPRLAPLNWRILCKEWGFETETSLKRGKSCTVQYKEWVLSSPMMIDRFKSNNYDCVAYWIPNADNEIESVYIYQDGRYIDECKPWGKFQEAKAERTEEDIEVMHRQLGYKASYKKMLRDGKTDKMEHLEIIPVQRTEQALAEAAKIEIVEALPSSCSEQEPEEEFALDFADLEYYANNALKSL